VLSKQENLSYDELLTQKLLSKLNMHDTTTIRSKVQDRLVAGRDKKGNITSNWDLNILAGAGAGLSSIVDMSKFVIANIGGGFEELNYQRQCHLENGKYSMGLGWFIYKRHVS